ncbi:MAG: CARDB domain-containing protein, partial [Desulfobacteraceae bacterium]
MGRRCLNHKGLNYYYNISVFIFLFFALFIAGPSFAQEFTAATIQNYDDISVIEVVGDYNTPTLDDPANAIPRQIIAKEFYTSHDDKYDFLVIFSNFDFQMPQYQIAGKDVVAAGFYQPVRNDVYGIGKDIFDNSSYFGSNGVLQGTIDMGYIENNTSDPLDPDLALTMRTLCHEIMHRWGAYVNYQKTDGTISGDILGSADAHWSYLFDSKGSVMYGNRWQDNGDGTFTSLPGYKYYGPLDLYLMGLIDKSEVPPMFLIENPNIDPETLPDEGAIITGIRHDISIDNIIAAEGERFPGPEESQKEFKIGFILITKPETLAQDEDLQAVRNIINNCVTWFSALTDGKARLIPDITLIEDIPENPGMTPPSYDPRTAPPEINDGVEWLIANQMDDGSWKDSSQTIERDTSEAVLALRNFSTADLNHALGLQWLRDNASLNTDYLSRKIEATILSGGDVSESLNELLLRQNTDGGWGSHTNYTSNPMDTSLALSALAAADYSDYDVIGSAIEYLKSEQNPDFGWGNGDQESLILTTTNVLPAFCHFRDIYELQDQIENGILWLLGKQNTDGGFGNSPSTVYDTAVAILALKELGVSSNITNDALDYIESLQSEDGSWYASPFQTALAVRAIWKVRVDPDLSVETGEISLTPEAVTRLPQEVQIDTLIRNNGLTGVPEVKVFLYEDVMSESNKIAEQVLAVSGASSETVTFTVTITDGDSHRFYVSVDPEGQVNESSESNNIALKMLYPEASHDFEIESSGISSSPMTADLMQDIFITSHIRNNGTMNAYDVLLRYYIDDPGQPVEIASITVDIPAGMTIEHELQWTASVAGSNLNLTVQADPNNTFTELSEDNNQAFTPVTVNPLTNPNLHIFHEDIAITPSPANQGGDASISANITNNGPTIAENIEVRFAKSLPGEEPVILGTRTVPSIASGQSTSVVFNWANIDETGERIIYIRVDPLNQVPELREDDNEAFTTLDILSFPDFTVSTSSIVFTPSIARDGDMVSIQTTVQNRGEQDKSNVPVTVYDGSAVIASGNIDLVPGNSQGTITFYYDTTGKSGVHKIMVTVDADDIIREQEENNNSASRFLGVQDSNMWLSERFISPDGDGTGDSTEFFFSIGEPQTVRVIIVDSDGNVIRTFSGEDFENTTGVFVTWDGLDEDGRLVKDGDYTIQVVSEQGVVLGSLIVTVDNNLSPLTDAIGTEFLLQTNLTCFLPHLGPFYSYNSWQWLPDESGIIFMIGRNNTDFPEYPAGLYRMGPAGEDITRLTPWTEDAAYSYRFYKDYYNSSGISMSVDGNSLYFVLEQYNKIEDTTSYQLWSIDQFGENLSLIEPSGATGFSDIAISPNGAYIAYNYYSVQNELRIAGTDGSEKVTIAVLDNDKPPVWSPNGQRLAYYSNDMIYITDLTGEIVEICPISGELIKLDWIGNEKIFFSTLSGGDDWNPPEENFRLVDASGGATPMNLASGLSPGWNYNPPNEFRPELIKSPDGNSFAFIDNSGASWTVKVCDNNGDCEIVHESPRVGYVDGYPSINDLRWSDEGSKLAFIDWAYEDLGSCYYNAYLVVFDRSTDQKSVSKVVTSAYGCEMPGSFYIQIQDPDSGSWIDAGTLHFGIQYQTKELDLTPWMKDQSGPVNVRVTQKGMDAANIDNIALIADREFLEPNNAVNITKGEDVLAKLLSDDRDVIDAYNSTLEIVWDDIPESRRVLLSLNAREEDLESRKASPFRYPKEGFYSVKLSQEAPIVVDGMITSSDALPEVLFEEFSAPITGHPNGYSYGYIKTDGEYLYGVLDFTPDNTLDHGRDWAGIEILTSGGSKSFVINDAHQEYGATSMAYTDRVDYEHKVYEFKIPLEEINAQVDDTIQVAFLAYGTAGDNNGFDNYVYQDKSLRWFKDGEFLLAQDDLGLFAIDYMNDEKIYLPILDIDSESYASLSPRGRYLTYDQYVSPGSACYGRGSRDLWRISSLLNLTANLRVSKKDSNIILKGIAADGHFDRYVLEYADKNTPDEWSLIAPPSDVMVIDDVLGTWIPPYPGSFYIRLSVYDKAGNMEWDRKRVSWGFSTSIAGLYLSEEYISPNGDGIKDFIELHYQILEPVHLEFYVYDQNGNIIRTFL